jgi:type I restriction enzyme M protein
VNKTDIAAQGYDLSFNRYKETVHEVAEHRRPTEILRDIKSLNHEIARGVSELEVMLG